VAVVYLYREDELSIAVFFAATRVDVGIAYGGGVF
jgi:hypothetical protein